MAETDRPPCGEIHHVVVHRQAPCSFTDKPINDAINDPIGKELFEKEQEDLLSDLKDIPKAACD
ncbi:hypothetical protein SESBI_43093 [Sesbania bispinosa]|nr:hypothetical protein SESBI_43093 [Sesbania bispinosa]